MQFPDGLPFLVFGNMAEIPRRVVAVPDTDIRAIREGIRAESGIKHGDAAFGGQPVLSEQGQSPDDHEIGLQNVEHGKKRPASERDFFRRGAGPVAVRFRFHVLEEHA